MSGGYFQYIQFRFGEIVETIRSVVANNDSDEKDECGYGRDYIPPDIIAKFTETANTVERAAKMVTRVDWLLSGDDGEDSFRRRWSDEGLDNPVKRV